MFLTRSHRREGYAAKQPNALAMSSIRRGMAIFIAPGSCANSLKRRSVCAIRISSGKRTGASTTRSGHRSSRKGLLSSETVKLHRAYHIARVRHVFERAQVFVFTLGLTEAWIDAASGAVFPTAPGVIAGDFDASRYKFKNFTFQETYDDLTAFFALAKQANSNVRFLLTVSPVPLTATASGEHVLQATAYSKSVLRAVAGQLTQDREDVDYVPSYEIITSGLSASRFFQDNLRSISSEGVDAVMRMFFSEQEEGGNIETPQPAALTREPFVSDEDEVVCEEAMLEAFAE